MIGYSGTSGGGTYYTDVNSGGDITTSITNVYDTSLFRQLAALGESFQPMQSLMYRVPTATRLEEAKSARHSIDDFALLMENWDGYGASPISDQARKHARNFINLIEAIPSGLPAPEVSPQPGGTISFEWEAPRAEVYFEIGNTRYSGFIKTTDQGQPFFLDGYADSMDRKIVALIQSALAGPPMYCTRPITEIRIQPHERLAA